MITPTNCPCCKDPLLNNEILSKKKGSIWIKTCLKRLDHKFSLTCLSNPDIILHFSIQISPNTFATWDLSDESKNIKIRKGILGNIDLGLKLSQDDFTLPYFEPDFSDYKKTIKKVNRYIILG